MAVTIADIARLVGVSQSTVSRVLNTPEQVKPATREKVLQAMEKHNYIYNALAGSLSRKRTQTLGVIIPTITNPIFAVSTKGMQDTAAKRGYSILLGSTDYSPALEYEIVKLFHAKQVDGIAFTGIPLDPRTADYLHASEVPHLITWDLAEDDKAACVTFDNQSAGCRVVDYLVSMGHIRIAMIAGIFAETGRAYKRYLGYREGLEKARLKYDDRLVIQKEYTIAAGQEAMTHFLHTQNRPTAVFCGNDILAYGAMTAIKKQGLRVGNHISVVGFDDLEMSTVFDPPLTTVRIPGYKMGELGATELIDSIEGKRREMVQHVLETEIIVRASVSSPG